MSLSEITFRFFTLSRLGFMALFGNLVFALPFVLHQLFEAVVTTWLGLWLLPLAKKMPH